MNKYTIALYIRLSSEDVDIDHDKIESSSIGNQRKLLRAFIKDNDQFKTSKVIEFCDDGYSGKNFNRPKVKKMLNMAKKKEIDCIIVKDFSRFGRDKIEVGNYLEHVFPFLGIRFISVNDGYDSSNIGDIGSLDSGFRVLLYDLYSRDISAKIKKTQRMKAEKGEYMPSFIPYGYLKDKQSGRYIINEEPAKIVRRIFNYTIQGKKLLQVAKILNDEMIPTKMKVKQKEGVRLRWNSVSDNNLWNKESIALIVRDETYIGARIYGKRAVTEIGSKLKKDNPREKWTIVYDRHEPIVSKEIFNQAQQKLLKVEREFNRRRPTKAFMYKKVRCSQCGLALKRRYSKGNPFFICGTPSKITNAKCYSGHIYYDDLRELMKEVIVTQAKIAVDLDTLRKEKQEKEHEKRKLLKKELMDRKMSLEKMNTITMELYESLILKEISDDIYHKEVAILRDKKDKIEVCIKDLERQLTVDEEMSDEFIETFKDYIDKDLITDDVMSELVSDVLVDIDGKIHLKLMVSNLIYNKII